MDPYSHKDMSAVATSWTVDPWTDPATLQPGSNITFTLRDNVYWHDGHKFDAFDAKFAWEYIARNRIPQYWADMSHFLYAEVRDPAAATPTKVSAYMDIPSQWLKYGLSGTAMIAPEHIYGCTSTRGGRATVSCTPEVENRWIGARKLLDWGYETGICLCEDTTWLAQRQPANTTADVFSTTQAQRSMIF
jgi:ABC-type transport system substrate-binding protein